jgi:cell division protease FtsH
VHTLNQLLTEIDGIAGNQSDQIVVVAATNRFEAIDTALLRSGRFDRHVWLKLPDVTARLEILRIHAKPIKLAPEAVDALKMIAEKSENFSGADLANLINEAVFFAIRRGANGLVSAVDLTHALAKTRAMVDRRADDGTGLGVTMTTRRSVLELN